jgi:hypothetical protein
LCILDKFDNVIFKLDNYRVGELYLHQTKTGAFHWHPLRERNQSYRSWQILPHDDVDEFTYVSDVQNSVIPVKRDNKQARGFIHTMEDDKEFEQTVRYLLANVPILAIREIQQIVVSYM